MDRYPENTEDRSKSIDALFDGEVVTLSAEETFKLVLSFIIPFSKFYGTAYEVTRFQEYDNYTDDESSMPEELMKSFVEVFIKDQSYMSELLHHGLADVYKGREIYSHIFDGIVIPDSASSRIVFLSEEDSEGKATDRYRLQLRMAYHFGDYKLRQIKEIYEYLLGKPMDYFSSVIDY